jgi:MoxR-like ATPase
MSVVQFCDRFRAEVSKAVVGQQAVVDQVLVVLLAGGHLLLEGVPGVAKTLLVRATAAAVDASFSRIQFTPDLMPSDVTGTNVFDQREVQFTFRPGPIFAGIVLADEINRTPPKTQSALLEAMEEKHVTIDGTRYALPAPFHVFATQNPIEFEGTYPLPEAQQDRFLLKILLDYPDPATEVEVYKRVHMGFRSSDLSAAGIQAITNPEGLAALRQEVNAVAVEDKIFNYIQEILLATRRSPDILVGASPRAGIALVLCGKALAAMRGREFVIPDDIKDLALPVLRHRVLLRPETEIEGLSADRVLRSILQDQVVPR